MLVKKKKSVGITFLYTLLCITMLMLVTELFSYATLRFVQNRKPHLIFVPRNAGSSEKNYNNYLLERDEYLGWPSASKFGTAAYDKYGARPAGRKELNDSPACVSTYGDSFTYGSKVDDRSAWPDVLSGLLDCRVDNYGVPGYGTGQALMRMIKNSDDDSPVVLLGIYPDDILRNMTQWFSLLSGEPGPGTKPRYVVEGGELRYVPMPDIEFKELSSFYNHPEKYLLHDDMLPGSRLGPVRMTFPYTLSVFSLGKKVFPHLRGNPPGDRLINSWPLWYPDHNGPPEKAKELLAKILLKYQEVCEERDKKCYVLLFPVERELSYFRKTGKSMVATLTADIDGFDLPVIDLTEPFVTALGDEDPCSIIGQDESCIGHYNKAGNLLVAKTVMKILQ